MRIASEHDAPRLSLLLQQLGSADPRPDPALLAIQLQRPRGDRVTLVAERGERLLGTCTLHLIEHLAHDFARLGDSRRTWWSTATPAARA